LDEPGPEPAGRIHSNLLLVLHYAPGIDPKEIYREHVRWNEMHTRHLPPAAAHTHVPDPERRLRIGYVSPDFREHAIARTFYPLLAGHDHGVCEVCCYASLPGPPDATTARMQAHADVWRDIASLTDDQAAAMIRGDGIDILVDLAGHTAGQRLGVFARRPAPVQVTYLGYPDTTGLEAIDHRLTDAWADPPGQTEALHSEQLVRLPGCGWVFDAADVPLPEDHGRDGEVVFGSFNILAKVTEPMLDLWGAILAAVPGSRLLAKARGLASAATRQRLVERFGAAGIEAERFELVGAVPAYRDHLALMARADIALDPFPYHGTTTTLETLWMGTPVITLAGATHVSRVGVSLLTAVGLADLVAPTPQAYVAAAVRLADDRDRLAGIRRSLRQRMREGGVLDGPTFARKVEAAYRRMWRHWCERRRA
jgi:protein O-GlcNAc transferase